MKHSTFAKVGMAAAALSFIMVIALAGCETDGDTLPNLEPPFVAVTSITGVPIQAEVGTDITLSGTVAPSNATNKTIVWSKKTDGTTATATVSDAGVVNATVAGDLIVTATIANGATETTPYTKDFTITVYAAGSLPTVSTVTVSPATVSVAKGGTQTFTAAVDGTNSPSQSVTWTIVETNKKAETSITTGGVLTVANDETLATLTVKATSDADNTKSGTATVTISNTPDPANGLTYEQVAAYLASEEVASKGATKEDPINLKLRYDAAGSLNNVHNAISSAQKYVVLDYSLWTHLTTIEGSGSGNDRYPHTIAYSFYDSIGRWNRYVTGITLPSTVQTIGDYAFIGAFGGSDPREAFKTITLPSDITSIRKNAFGSSGIKEIDIPDSVTAIGESAFYNVEITELILPASLETIGKSAFKLVKIAELTIPEYVTTIGEEAFTSYYSAPLRNVTFAGSIAQHTEVGDEFVSGIHMDAFNNFEGNLYNAYFGLDSYAQYDEGELIPGPFPGTYVYDSGLWEKQPE